MIDEHDIHMQAGEPAGDNEKDTRELESRDKDQPLWERWENWTNVVDR